MYRFVDTESHNFHNQALRGLRTGLYTHSYRVILHGFNLDTMVCVTWLDFEANTATTVNTQIFIAANLKYLHVSAVLGSHHHAACFRNAKRKLTATAA